MNKKLTAIIFLMILSSHITLGQINEEQLEGGLNKLEDSKDIIEDKDARNAYLKQEWTNILTKTEWGNRILKINDFIKFLNPAIKIIVGVDYSLSWEFLFALLFWVSLFVLIYLSAPLIFNNALIALVATFLITSIIGLSGAIKESLKLFALFIPNKWIAILIFIIWILFITYLGKYEKGEIKKRQEEQDKEIIHAKAEVSRAYFKEIEKKK